MADPTPWDKPAITNVASSQATAHSTDEMVNSATPTMKVRLRPMVSLAPAGRAASFAEGQHGGDHPAAAVASDKPSLF